MNIGEILIKFGAETSGLMEGLRLAMGALGLFGGASKTAGSGLASITSQIAATEARLVYLKGSAIAGGVGINGMSSTIAGLEARLVSLKASQSAVSATMKESSAVVDGLKMSLMALVAIFVLVAAAAIAIGIVSVKMAADFQQGMNRLVTGAGDVTDNMGKMGQSILGISTATGVLTGQLLPAMYQIISAGQRGAQAEDTLRVAAMGSVAEQAKIVDVAKAITTAMTDYGTAQFNATQFMNGYTRATQLGKITLEELSNSMGPILPLAKNIGISFADVAGAMSTMTNAGIPAERSATSLRFLFQSMEVPTHKARAAMESMGLSSVAVGNELKKSLPGALEMIYKAALKAGPEGSVPFNRAVSDMIGGQRSLQAYLALTGTHFATYSANARAIADAMNHSKTAVLGWDTAQTNFNVKLDMAKAALAALAITIGTALLPVVTQIVGQITPLIAAFTEWVVKSNAVSNAIKAMTPFFQAMLTPIIAAMPYVIGAFIFLVSALNNVLQWIGHNQVAMKAIMIIAMALGAIIVGVVAAGLLLLVIGFGTVVLAIAVVVGVVMGLIYAWNALVVAFDWVKAVVMATPGWFMGVWNAIASWFMGLLSTIGTFFVNLWNGVVAFFVNLWDGVSSWVVATWERIKANAAEKWGAMGAAIQNAVASVVKWLQDAWKNCVEAIFGFFTWMYNHNYYWQMGVDAIKAIVQGGIDFVTRAWKQGIDTLTGWWKNISGVASATWNAVSTAVMTPVNATVSWLRTAWTTSIAWIGQKWGELGGLATTAWNFVKGVFASVWGWMSGTLANIWNGISGWFSSTATGMQTKTVDAWASVGRVVSGAWSTYIAGPLNALWSSISGWLGSTATNLYNAGMNFMNMLGQGITNGVNYVKNAVGGVAASIWAALGFHSPPQEGPAKDSDTWMPNMVDMLASGIQAGVPQIQSAVNLLLGPVKPLSAPVSATVAPTGNYSRSGSGVTGSGQTFILEVDGRVLAQIVNTSTDRLVRLKLGANGRG